MSITLYNRKHNPSEIVLADLANSFTSCHKSFEGNFVVFKNITTSEVGVLPISIFESEYGVHHSVNQLITEFKDRLKEHEGLSVFFDNLIATLNIELEHREKIINQNTCRSCSNFNTTKCNDCKYHYSSNYVANT